jgi:dTDP-4-amino-4,6-dideoxygalactose transaminase
MGGQPADMPAIMAIARKHKLLVIEDAAHAHGAMCQGQPVGSIGHAGSFSFQSSKNLTSGEGGIIVTNDDKLAASCRSIHNCGRAEAGLWYEHHVISGNYRLGEFQGAVLNAQMDRIEEQVRIRDRNGKYLASRLSAVPGIHPQERSADRTRHGYHLFLFRIDAKAFGVSREVVLKALQAEGIPVTGGYPIPLYRQPLFLNRAFGPYLSNAVSRLDYSKVSCPNCEKICAEQGAWFEHNLLLGTELDMDEIARALEKIYENRAALTDLRT